VAAAESRLDLPMDKNPHIESLLSSALRFPLQFEGKQMWMGVNATRAVALLGPASSASPNGGHQPILWFTGAALLAIFWVREHKRGRALRAMAIRRGLSFLGRALPRSFTLRDTAFDGATSIWNVIDGDCRGIRVMAFDCRIGTGKSSCRRTAIAAQGPPDVFGVFGAVKFNTDLTVDRSGDWSVLYRSSSSGLMSVSELEAHLESIGR
jgi:hypothetical protein